MKLKFKTIGLAIIALSIAALPAMARDNNNTCKRADRQEQCRRDGNFRKDCKRDKECLRGFEGINLTDAEKARIKQLNQKRDSLACKNREARKTDRKRTDSIAAGRANDNRREYLEEVKAILGPERYVVYLENVFVNSNRRPHKGKVEARKYDKQKKMPRYQGTMKQNDK